MAKLASVYLLLLLGPLPWILCDQQHQLGGQTIGSDGQPRPRTIEEEEQYFLKLIFEKYGHGGKISFEGFEHLLESLGLARLLIDDHDIHDHKQDGRFKEFHPTHSHSSQLNKTADDNNTVTTTTDNNDHHDHHDDDHDHKTTPIVDHNNDDHDHKTPIVDHHDESRHEDDHDHKTTPIVDHHDDKSRHVDDHDHAGNHEMDKPVAAPDLNSDPVRVKDDSKRENENENEDETLEESSIVEPSSSSAATNDSDRSETTSHKKRHRDHRKNKSKNKKKKKKKKKTTTTQKKKTDLKSEQTPNSDRNRHKRALPLEQPKMCLTPLQLLSAYHLKFQKGLSQYEFLKLCPAIVYQLDIHVCNERYYYQDCFHQKQIEHLKLFHKHRNSSQSSDHHNHNHGDDDDDDGHHGKPIAVPFDISKIPARVWGFASLAVTVISLVGLLGVAIVPIMQKVFYNHLIMFLVALAVGSLTGDAMLHLLPHAIATASENHSHDSEGEGHSKDGVYKGLVVLSGIYFFFLAERFMNIISDKRRRKKTTKKRKIRVKDRNGIGKKLSEYGSELQSSENVVMVLNPSKEQNHDELHPITEEHELDDHHHHDNHHHHHDNDVESHHHHHHGDGSVNNLKGHGHSHHGGEIPTSIASVAYMVIMGDGLHNFSDGLAIGAAFANGITGGLSTSIAVFCHELPHELGDFAMLLKAGMTVKQALFYNIVSSVLCFVGMIIGIAVGNISTASLWIFAIAGGMFVYIALVDMLPEISLTEHGDHGNLGHLLIQSIGILLGTGIMLLIALYEDQIRVVVEEP
ncbi:zinc transporter ZIP10-like [Tubulanus polymorphus]|uniref:zinc transporter ZIP10-like n=1 Tax=Tubulanus polymorphus TaxID=672921 RepID=UPI003DA30ED2